MERRAGGREASGERDRRKSLTLGIFSSYYPPHMGGVEQFSRNLAHELAGMGHRVVVVACNATSSPDVEAEDDAVEIHRLPAADLLGRLPLPRAGAAFRRHWSAIGEIPFDGIIVNTRFYPLSILASKMAWQQGVRPVVIEHGSAHLRIGTPPLDRLIARYEHLATAGLRRSSPRCYGVSAEASAWLGHFGIRAAGVIRNAIDASGFRGCASGRDFRLELDLPSDAPIAAFTGRFVREKGVWTVLEAARLLEGSSDVRFLLAGDGPEREALVRAAGPNVGVLGRLGRPDVAALLLESDIFCFPSSYPEGLPTSLLEAAACEAYIVTTPVGGAGEVVATPEMGCILEDASPETLARAVREALSDPRARDGAARACRLHVERKLSWRSTAQAAVDACLEARVEAASP